MQDAVDLGARHCLLSASSLQHLDWPPHRLMHATHWKPSEQLLRWRYVILLPGEGLATLLHYP